MAICVCAKYKKGKPDSYLRNQYTIAKAFYKSFSSHIANETVRSLLTAVNKHVINDMLYVK